MSTERTPRTDKELWRSIAPDRDVAPQPISDLEFAAWLEGRLPEAAAARIEATVAADPVMRRAALDLADVLGKPLPAAPARLVVRAQALVGFAAGRQVAREGFLDRLFSSGSRYALPRAAMAAVVIVIAGAGFIVGGGLGESFAQQRQGADVTRASSGELTDFSDGI